MVGVRDAEPEDAEAVMAAHVAAVEAGGPSAYDERQVAAWAERPDGADPYRAHARDDGHVFVVAEREDADDAATENGTAVVGFGHLVPPAERDDDHPPGEGEVRAVYVHGDHADEGVGSALLDHLEAAARERGLDALVLTASLNAVGFYERHGYERDEEAVHETTGGVELEVVVMRRELAAADAVDGPAGAGAAE